MRFTVHDEEGAPIEFTCPDGLNSRMTCGAILEGKTYPYLPFLADVTTVLDVGANCGAMSVHMARHYPGAAVHAFEPGTEALGYLRDNVADLPNVIVHPFGLHDHDEEVPLYLDGTDLGRSSIVPPAGSGGAVASEVISLRSAGAWAAAAGIERIDILKVDVEGCEIQVLESLGSLLPAVQVLHVEYDSRTARRDLARLLDPTHELYFAMLMSLDQGECMYLRSDLADHPQALDRVRGIFAHLSRR